LTAPARRPQEGRAQRVLARVDTGVAPGCWWRARDAHAVPAAHGVPRLSAGVLCADTQGGQPRRRRAFCEGRCWRRLRPGECHARQWHHRQRPVLPVHAMVRGAAVYREQHARDAAAQPVGRARRDAQEGELVEQVRGERRQDQHAVHAARAAAAAPRERAPRAARAARAMARRRRHRGARQARRLPDASARRQLPRGRQGRPARRKMPPLRARPSELGGAPQRASNTQPADQAPL